METALSLTASETAWIVSNTMMAQMPSSLTVDRYEYSRTSTTHLLYRPNIRQRIQCHAQRGCRLSRQLRIFHGNRPPCILLPCRQGRHRLHLQASPTVQACRITVHTFSFRSNHLRLQERKRHRHHIHIPFGSITSDNTIAYEEKTRKENRPHTNRQVVPLLVQRYHT